MKLQKDDSTKYSDDDTPVGWDTAHDRYFDAYKDFDIDDEEAVYIV